MYTILVVDDEIKIIELIKKYIEFEGYKAITVSTGMDALETLDKHKDEIDIIVLDIMLPDIDGFSTLKKIRKTSDIPVIFLSAKGEEYDKIHGFDVGADDYVSKPFSPKELIMRIEAILKRGKGKQNLDSIKEDIFRYENLVVDYKGRKVTINGDLIKLTPKEYELLIYFIKNKNIAIGRESILNNIWGYDFYGDDRTLDTHIKSLRKSLGEYSKMITTLRGVGYRFEV